MKLKEKKGVLFEYNLEAKNVSCVKDGEYKLVASEKSKWNPKA